MVFPEKRRLVVSGVCQREQLLSACWFLKGFKEKQFSFDSLHFSLHFQMHQLDMSASAVTKAKKQPQR